MKKILIIALGLFLNSNYVCAAQSEGGDGDLITPGAAARASTVPAEAQASSVAIVSQGGEDSQDQAGQLLIHRATAEDMGRIAMYVTEHHRWVEGQLESLTRRTREAENCACVAFVGLLGYIWFSSIR